MEDSLEAAACTDDRREFNGSPRLKVVATGRCRCCDRQVEPARLMNRIFQIQPTFCPGCSIRHHDAYVRTHSHGHPDCAAQRGRVDIEPEGPVGG